MKLQSSRSKYSVGNTCAFVLYVFLVLFTEADQSLETYQGAQVQEALVREAQGSSEVIPSKLGFLLQKLWG